MAILSIPSLTKGVSDTVALNKGELFSLSVVATDSFYSIPENIKKCLVRYQDDAVRDSEISQYKLLVFDMALEAPTCSIFFSSTARDHFLIKEISLLDKDGGSLLIKDGDIPSGLDISL